MERAPETSSTGMSQGWALAIVAGVLVTVGLTWYLTGSSAEPTPTETPTPPDFSLTDEEAIARFKELDQLRQRMYRDRDASLVSVIYADGSPVQKRVLEDLQVLRRDRVLSRTTFETESLRVESTDAGEVKLMQVVVVDPNFVSESGSPVEGSNVTQRLTIEWTLVPQAGEWLLHDSVITDSEKL